MTRTTIKAALAGAILSLVFAAGAAQAAAVGSDAVRSVAAQTSSAVTQVHARRHHHHRRWHRHHHHRHCGFVRRCGKWGCRILRRCHRDW